MTTESTTPLRAYSVTISVAGEGRENRWYRPQRGLRVIASSEGAACKLAANQYRGQDPRIVRCDLSSRAYDPSTDAAALS